MSHFKLPTNIEHVKVPPIKCQGIKTKLIKFIASSIKWDEKGKWIEPFLGSGVVAFNIAPESALLSDTNKHIIKFYQDLQDGSIDEKIVREYLEDMGEELSSKGEEFYYDVRNEFNAEGGSLRLLFLNRSCFNGMMRFNNSGGYNVPFGHKPERFRPAYVTKIVNQVKWVRKLLTTKEYEFQVCDWHESLKKSNEGDFVYLDPPYIGRHTDYYNSWKKEDAVKLANVSDNLPCGFALSMWFENRYRKNDHIKEHWDDHALQTVSHFYHLGSKEKYRNSMTEALVIKEDYQIENNFPKKPGQLELIDS